MLRYFYGFWLCVATHWIAVLTWGPILWAQNSSCALSTVLWNQYAFKIEIFEASSIYLFFSTDNNTVNIKGQHTPALSNMRQNARPHYFLCANTHWRQLDTPGSICCCWLHCKGYLLFSKQYRIFRLSTWFSLSNYKYNKCSHLCCSWIVLTFLFLWLETSEGTLLSPSRLEWETKVLVVLIKRCAKLGSVGVCWP